MTMAPLTSPRTNLRTHYARPTTFPLHRTYYYLDWSPATLTQLTPYLVAGQPRESKLHWHTDAMWSQRIHWPLTRDAWDLEDALHAVTDGGPALPEGWHTFPHPSSPLPLYQSPIGHVFQLRKTYDPRAHDSWSFTPFPCWVPPPYPVQRDDANIIAAQLHHPFFCYLCSTTHPIDNRTARRCRAVVMASFSQEPGTTTTDSFTNLTRYLFDRVDWVSQHTPLTSDQLAAFIAFDTGVKDHRVEHAVPPLPLQVFTTPGGLQVYHQHIHTLRDEYKARYLLCQTRVEALADHLARLIPPGVPVGPPIARTPDSSHGLSQETSQEVDRIRAILSDHRCTIRYDHSALILEFTKPRRRRADSTPRANRSHTNAIGYFWTLLTTRFKASFRSLLGDHTRCLLHSVDSLGLDPAFWKRVSFTATQLTFRSQPIERRAATPPALPQSTALHQPHQLSFLESTRIRHEYRSTPT